MPPKVEFYDTHAMLPKVEGTQGHAGARIATAGFLSHLCTVQEAERREKAQQEAMMAMRQAAGQAVEPFTASRGCV